MTDRNTPAKKWHPMKRALFSAIVDEALNDGKYINSFDLSEKLFQACLPHLTSTGLGQCASFKIGDRVEKISGSEWAGCIVGYYSTLQTPVGYAVESEHHAGSVQIYPEKALRHVTERPEKE